MNKQPKTDFTINHLTNYINDWEPPMQVADEPRQVIWKYRTLSKKVKQVQRLLESCSDDNRLKELQQRYDELYARYSLLIQGAPYNQYIIGAGRPTSMQLSGCRL